MNSPCPCPGTRSTIRFATGLCLVRCSQCDSQLWTLGDRVVAKAVAHTALRASFADHRKLAPRKPRAVPAPRLVVDLRETAPAEVHLPATAPAQAVPRQAAPATSGEQTGDLQSAVNALLASKGLTGSWQLSA